jgi:hypothetical protein
LVRILGAKKRVEENKEKRVERMDDAEFVLVDSF